MIQKKKKNKLEKANGLMDNLIPNGLENIPSHPIRKKLSKGETFKRFTIASDHIYCNDSFTVLKSCCNIKQSVSSIVPKLIQNSPYFVCIL